MRQENVQNQKGLEKIHDTNQKRVSKNNNAQLVISPFVFFVQIENNRLIILFSYFSGNSMKVEMK